VRKNILQWLDALKGPVEHLVILTHNVDLLYVENVLLPRLRDLGEPALMIIADAACAAMTFANQAGLTSSLGRRYRVIGVDLGGMRRFHPKAIFVLKKEQAHLAIGSGNLTAGGYGGNFEAWMTWDTIEEERPVIAAFLRVLQQLPSLISMPERLDNLTKAIADASFLQHLPESQGLLSSFSASILGQMERLAPKPVQEIIIISPYFDSELVALRRLGTTFGSKLTILAQPKRSGLSREQFQSLPPEIRVCALKPASDDEKRFIHAKVYAIRTGDRYYVFLGSANCSMAALILPPSQANAELMAYTSLNETQWAGFMAELEIDPHPPELKLTSTDEDDERFTGRLRIAAARFDSDVLMVDLVNADGFVAFSLGEHESRFSSILHKEDGCSRVRFPADAAPKSLVVRGFRTDDTFVDTPASWVDDETALGLSSPGRRLQRKFGELGENLEWSAADYAEILEIFGDHLVREMARSTSKARVNFAPKGEGEYSLLDIFSDGLDKTAGTFGLTNDEPLTNENVLNTILAMLGIETEPAEENLSGEIPVSLEDLTEQELRKKELPKAPPVDQGQLDSHAKERLRRRMIRALQMIERTMLAAGYVERRTVPRLIRGLGALGVC